MTVNVGANHLSIGHLTVIVVANHLTHRSYDSK